MGVATKYVQADHGIDMVIRFAQGHCKNLV
jgi:hypothetical protein